LFLTQSKINQKLGTGWLLVAMIRRKICVSETVPSIFFFGLGHCISAKEIQIVKNYN